jgi:hypothetical protein
MNIKNNTLYISIYSPDHCEAVQNRLFEMGVKWTDGSTSIGNRGAKGLLVANGKMSYYGLSASRPSYEHKVITLEDLYNGKVKEGPKEIVVTLNDGHKAIVSTEGVKVGCQSFPLTVISALVEARDKVLAQ